MAFHKIIQTLILSLGIVTILPVLAQADAPHRHSRPYGNSPMGYSAATFRGVPWARPNYSNSHGRDRYPDRLSRNTYGRKPGSSILTQGFRDGRLSRSEFLELKDKQQALRRQERAYWADGRLSKNERKELRDSYKDFRNDLKHELRDGERREFRNYGWHR